MVIVSVKFIGCCSLLEDNRGVECGDGSVDLTGRVEQT